MEEQGGGEMWGKGCLGRGGGAMWVEGNGWSEGWGGSTMQAKINVESQVKPVQKGADDSKGW